MANPNIRTKNYLHPTKLNQGFRSKDYKVIQSGVLLDGTKISQLQSRGNPSINHSYKNLIISEVPGAKPKLMFGSYDSINQISADLKSEPEKVLRSLKPIDGGVSGAYYLNSSPTQQFKSNPSKSAAADYARNERFYPSENEDDTFQTLPERETAEFGEHLKQDMVNHSNDPFPNSGQEKARIDGVVDSVIGNGPSHAEPQTALSGEVSE